MMLSPKTSEDRREQSDTKQTGDGNVSVQEQTLFLEVAVRSTLFSIKTGFADKF